jgi:hypothetical protein
MTEAGRRGITMRWGRAVKMLESLIVVLEKNYDICSILPINKIPK